jgi:hypothetical protein
MKSDPQALSPQATVTVLLPGPVPVHAHGGALASPLPAQVLPVHDQPEALQEYTM